MTTMLGTRRVSNSQDDTSDACGRRRTVDLCNSVGIRSVMYHAIIALARPRVDACVDGRGSVNGSPSMDAVWTQVRT